MLSTCPQPVDLYKSSAELQGQPIRLVTVGAGGGGDFVTRLIAQGISGPLGQPVDVDNRTGNIAIDIVAKAPPDGHTLLVYGPPFWTAPLLEKVTYDPMRDFSPITLAISQPNILVVPASLPVNSVEELIALARARPGELYYGSGITGSSSQLAGALFTYMAGIDMVRASFKSGGLVGVKDVIAGKVHLMIPSLGSGMPHVKAGRLKALAVTSTEPSALAPGLPAVAATLPGFAYVQKQGVFAPAKTPSAVIQRLNGEIVRFLKTAEAKERLFDAGMEAEGTTPEELAIRIKSETDMLRKVIEHAGIKAD